MQIFGLGLPELLIIGAILVFLFGAKKLPEMATGLGKAITNFKRSVKEQPEQQVEENQEEETEKKD
jgi:sec-independent protein translocase protein TatA